VPLNATTVVIGIVVTITTMAGGIQGVIWTDVVQFFVMFGGLTATVWIVWASVPGGFAEIWRTAAEAGLLNPWPPLVDPAAAGAGVGVQIMSFLAQPVTLVSLLVSLVVGRAAQYTSDQVMVQRLQTTRSLPETRRAFVINAAGDALWMIGLSFVGLALFAYFRHNTLPPEYATDKLLPYFMSLGPHDFYWLALDRPQSAETAAERPPLTMKGSWLALLDPVRRVPLSRALLSFATQRRWFRGKARTRKHVAISDILMFEDARHAIALFRKRHGRSPGPYWHSIPRSGIGSHDQASYGLP